MRLFVTSDASDVRERLLEAATAAEDLRPIADQLLGVLRSASARQFASGSGWARSEKASGLTLVDTGRLRDSLTRAGGDSRTLEREGEVTIVSTVPYASYLADGARGMPRRDPSLVDEWRVGRDAAQVLADYIAGAT